MKKNTANKVTQDTNSVYEKFDALPLNEKFTSLFKMELTALGEAINYVVKDPMKVVEQIGKVLGDFGTKVESEVRKAAASASGDNENGTAYKTSRPRRPAEPVPPAA